VVGIGDANGAGTPLDAHAPSWPTWSSWPTWRYSPRSSGCGWRA